MTKRLVAKSASTGNQTVEAEAAALAAIILIITIACFDTLVVIKKELKRANHQPATTFSLSQRYH